MHQNGGAGFLPAFGAGAYGRATQGASPIEPWAHVQGFPQVGGFFEVFHEIGLPNLPGGIVMGFGSTMMPLGNGWLFVDPAVSTFEFAMTDAAGVIQKRHNIPAIPALIGLPIHQQAGIAGPGGQLSLTNAVRCVID